MKLYPFQAEGVNFLASRSRALLAHEMGLGKSVMAIKAVIKTNSLRVLIVCPASVKYVWEKEIEKWTDSGAQVINTSKAQISDYRKWTVVNYDLLISKPIFLQLINYKWDVLILDEAHYLKNNRAKRTKAVYYPKGLADQADRVWLLTGTPVLNRPIELFSHLKALVPDLIAPKFFSRHDFATHFCNGYMGEWGWNESGASNEEELAKILSEFMLRRLKKDVLKDLPDKTYQTIFLKGNKQQEELNKKEREVYERSQNSILGETATLRRECGIKKIPQIVEHVTNVLEAKRKIVLFAYHRDIILELSRALAEYSPAVLAGSTPSNKRQDEVERFRSSTSCRVFIGQIEAAGTGIDGLQDVCDTVIFGEMSYVPGQISQAIDRCHRIGQKNNVLVQFLIAEGSIDEDIADSIARKEKIIDKIVKKTIPEGFTQECLPVAEHILKRIVRVLVRF